jgi:hypothetical protein
VPNAIYAACGARSFEAHFSRKSSDWGYGLGSPSLLVVNEGRYRKPVEGLLIAQVLVLFDRRRERFA